MKQIRIFVLTLITSAATCLAQDTVSSSIPASLPMIDSQEDLRNYALGLVKYGGRSVYSPSMDWNYTNTFAYTNGNGGFAEEILDKLFSVPFRYRLTNPNDSITGTAWLYDNTNNYNLVFYGSATYKASDLKQTNAVRYSIWPYNVPLPLTNVVSAQVLALNPDGSTAAIESTLSLNNGQPIYPAWMAGIVNGLLAVKFKDGTIASYRLSNPTNQVAGQIGETAGYKVTGHYVYEPTSDKTNVLMSIIELYDRPTAFLKASTQVQVTVDVSGVVQNNGVTFERPTAMIVTPVGKDYPLPRIPLNADRPTAVTLPIGSFRIKFEWTNFAKPGMFYTGNVAVGGKG